MFVRLNLEGNISLKRTFSVADQVSEQSVIDATGMETPLIMSEYKERISSLNLDIAEFCFYQDKLVAYTQQNLNEIFEKMSGSISFKEEYDNLLE